METIRVSLDTKRPKVRKHKATASQCSLEDSWTPADPLPIEIGTVPSVKVEVVPDLDLMLENSLDSGNEVPDVHPNKRLSIGQNNQDSNSAIKPRAPTDPRSFEIVSCPQNSSPNTAVNYSQDVSGVWNKLHKCRLCDDTFESDSALEFHANSHSDGKHVNSKEKPGRFKCGGHDGNPCPRVYILKSSLKKHMFRFSKRVNSNRCDICGKEFEFVSTLTRHVMLVHRKAGEYKCSHCDKEFLHKTSLDRHILTHGKVRDHKCEICGKEFAYRDALTSHVSTHSVIREHKCYVCGREFLKRANMKSHVLTHSKVYDKKCGVCGKVYAQKRSLNNHMLTHIDETGHNR